jgi:mercuric ion binding protein
MKRVFDIRILATLVLLSTSASRGEVREWTRAADGRKISAEFVAMKDANTVTIKARNGQTYDLPLASLSPEDGAYAKEAAAKMVGAPGAGATAPTGPKPALPEGETTVTLSKVHICCGDCVDAVAKIGLDPKNPIPAGVTITADRGNEAIVVKAPTGKDAQAALRAVVGAGFYGVSDHPAVLIPDLKPDDFTAETMVVRDTHLCCGGCVRAFTKAVESVEGVESCEAKSGATSAKVAGKGFKPYEVMKALREAGFGGSFQ